MRVWLAFGIFWGVGLGANWVAADPWKIDYDPTITTAPPGYVASLPVLLPLGPPDPCECPGNAQTDGPEECSLATCGLIDTINGGCNGTTPTFQSIDDGDTVCGNIHRFEDCGGGGNNRDCDWFGPIEAAQESVIRWSARANFKQFLWIMREPNPADPCSDGALTVAFSQFNPDPGFPPNCNSPLSIEACVPPGTYYVVISRGFGGGTPAGAQCGVDGTSYTADLEIGVFDPVACACVADPGQDWNDGFDAYPAPGGIIGNGSWEGWDEFGPNAVVIANASQGIAECCPSPGSDSSPQSLRVGGNGLKSDLVRRVCFGPGDGIVTLRGWYFIPGDMMPDGINSGDGSAYFNVLNSYRHLGPKNWSVQLRMNAQEGVVDDRGGSPGGSPGTGASSILVANDWAQVEVEVNLGNNTHRLRYDGIDLFAGVPQPWAGTPTTGGAGKVAIEALEIFNDAATSWFADEFSTDSDSGRGVDIIRGDVDANGIFNPLIDALYALGAGFIPGSPEPPCLAAADADADLVNNALVDALFVLGAGFLPGSPLPPPPFPNCGPDPQIATLGCENPPSLCNP